MPSRTSKVFALSLGQGLTTIVGLVSGMVMARILRLTAHRLSPPLHYLPLASSPSHTYNASICNDVLLTHKQKGHL